MNEQYFVSVFHYKVIYAFTIEDTAHRGLIKIGDATVHTELPIDSLAPNSKPLNQAALTRIKSYTNTAGIRIRLLHTELAVRTIKKTDGTSELKAFRDHDVHAVLKNSNIKNVKVGGTSGSEWFRIDIETAKKAIAAVKLQQANLSGTSHIIHTPIVLRPEQEECVKKAVSHFKKADKFLLNAKMRFGKTIVALTIVKSVKDFHKTIIITHRPVVNYGWFEDFRKVFADDDNYVYGSKNNGYSVDELLKTGKNFVYFASVQDLRGSVEVGGKFEKNDTIFDTIWDCVIVDEAHEGTTTALGEETVSAVVKNELGKTKLLALSGTPFNILADYDDKSIYTWDYIMEQEKKTEWDKYHFGDSNPYEELPALKIFTYNLGELMRKPDYITYEDKAFNFREFFRTWTGDMSYDYIPMPSEAHVGNFVHEQDVWSFLNLMTHEDDNSNYPFSKEKYRKLFHHTLWMIPGVREAKALKALMQKHPVFGLFNIVNVAGNDDEESSDALESVRNAINDAGDSGYTITLSCGKLTTGVTVKEWTGVFMLAGSYSTSAANYLQTIFRVQSPCNKDGRIKDVAYVFDFAPDRTLKMVASAVSVSSKAGKTTQSDRKIMGKFLNYCSVISISGSQMKEYNVGNLLQQLKRSYADRVVRSGFDDTRLYTDALLNMSDADIEILKNLNKIIGKNKAARTKSDIMLNDQGLTDAKREELERLKKKQKGKKELTPEEKAKLEELKKLKEQRTNAIAVLRGVSIRMPLLVFGADVSYDDDITLNRFIELVDDSSWKEFMPDGFTKDHFRKIQKYYDEEIFIGAGKRIRNAAKEADTMEPMERVKKIGELFSHFKNPDKEKVLTPWEVVNLHMSTTIGGWNFWDFKHDTALEKPEYVRIEDITESIFDKDGVEILEINSKTGLYPLYVTYSIYRQKISGKENQLTFEDKTRIWRETVDKNIFVICNTPMAKQITKRTLLGYSKGRINAHYFENLVNIMQNKPESFVEKASSGRYWKKGRNMKFDAIVGNPPYMIMDGGAKASAKPIYQYFIQTAKKLAPRYASFIIPTRWYSGGKGLDDFRNAMLDDKNLRILHDCLSPEDVFPSTNIRGGVCWFLLDKEYNNSNNKVHIITHEHDTVINDVMRDMRTVGTNLFIRDYRGIEIISKIKSRTFNFMPEHVSPRQPFGIEGNASKLSIFKDNSAKMKRPIKCYIKQMKYGYVEYDDIPRHKEWALNYKVFTPYANNIGTELNDDNLNTFIGEPNTICSESYIAIGLDLNLDFNGCQNISKYLSTKFARFLLSLAKGSQHGTAKTYQFIPIQDFTTESDINWSGTVHQIDLQLYAKYHLTDVEIQHIEKKIKSMEK